MVASGVYGQALAYCLIMDRPSCHNTSLTHTLAAPSRRCRSNNPTTNKLLVKVDNRVRPLPCLLSDLNSKGRVAPAILSRAYRSTAEPQGLVRAAKLAVLRVHRYLSGSSVVERSLMVVTLDKSQVRLLLGLYRFNFCSCRPRAAFQ